MSYDIELIDPKTKETVILGHKHNLKGGTYAIGGTDEAWLNVTYNYGKFFRRVFGEEGIRIIYGKTGAESTPILEEAISKLEGEPSDNYWGATEGNAKKALEDLLELAKMAPFGVWEGD